MHVPESCKSPSHWWAVVTLFPIHDKVGLLTSSQHFIKVCQAILESFVIDEEIIHEHLHDLLDQIREYRHHAPLK
jgi:hypothetical protein